MTDAAAPRSLTQATIGPSMTDLILQKHTDHGLGTDETEVLLSHLTTHLRHSVPGLWDVYQGMSGHQEWPAVVVENQCDEQKSDYAKNLMTRISKHIHAVIALRDEEINKERVARGEAPIQRRALILAQKKWLMRHDGSYGDRADNKRVSTALVEEMVDHYAFTAGRVLLRDAKETRLSIRDHRHDLADAYLMPMQVAEEAYAQHAKGQLPRRKPGQQRADCPVLTEAQRANGGTIRVCGIDPGEVAMGLCLLELEHQQLPPLDKGVNEWKPEPLFRIHTWQLINLKQQEPRKAKDYSLLRLDARATLCQPAYDTKDIRSFFQRAEAVSENYIAQKAARDAQRDQGVKRARPISRGQVDDARPSPAKKARQEDPENKPEPRKWVKKKQPDPPLNAPDTPQGPPKVVIDLFADD